jgi:hypothetical protein
LALDTPAIYAEWRRIVTTYTVSGVNAHDSRIVAAMKVHGLRHLVTFNTEDLSASMELKSRWLRPRKLRGGWLLRKRQILPESSLLEISGHCVHESAELTPSSQFLPMLPTARVSNRDGTPPPSFHFQR